MHLQDSVMHSCSIFFIIILLLIPITLVSVFQNAKKWKMWLKIDLPKNKIFDPGSDNTEAETVVNVTQNTDYNVDGTNNPKTYNYNTNTPTMQHIDTHKIRVLDVTDFFKKL